MPGSVSGGSKMETSAMNVLTVQLCWVIASMIKMTIRLAYFLTQVVSPSIFNEVSKESKKQLEMAITLALLAIVYSTCLKVTVMLMDAIKKRNFESMLTWYWIYGFTLVLVAVTFFSEAGLDEPAWDRRIIAIEVVYFVIPFICFARLGLLLAKWNHMNGNCYLAFDENAVEGV